MDADRNERSDLVPWLRLRRPLRVCVLPLPSTFLSTLPRYGSLALSHRPAGFIGLCRSAVR